MAAGRAPGMGGALTGQQSIPWGLADLLSSLVQAAIEGLPPERMHLPVQALHPRNALEMRIQMTWVFPLAGQAPAPRPCRVGWPPP